MSVIELPNRLIKTKTMNYLIRKRSNIPSFIINKEQYSEMISQRRGFSGQGVITIKKGGSLVSYVLESSALVLSGKAFSRGQISKAMYECLALENPKGLGFPKRKFIWKTVNSIPFMSYYYKLDFKEAYYYALRSIIGGQNNNFDNITMPEVASLKRCRTSIATVQQYSKVKCFNMLDEVSYVLFNCMHLLASQIKKLGGTVYGVSVDGITSNKRLDVKKVSSFLSRWWGTEGFLSPYSIEIVQESNTLKRKKPVIKNFFMPLRQSVYINTLV